MRPRLPRNGEGDDENFIGSANSPRYASTLLVVNGFPGDRSYKKEHFSKSQWAES